MHNGGYPVRHVQTSPTLMADVLFAGSGQSVELPGVEGHLEKREGPAAQCETPALLGSSK